MFKPSLSLLGSMLCCASVLSAPVYAHVFDEWNQQQQEEAEANYAAWEAGTSTFEASSDCFMTPLVKNWEKVDAYAKEQVNSLSELCNKAATPELQQECATHFKEAHENWYPYTEAMVSLYLYVTGFDQGSGAAMAYSSTDLKLTQTLALLQDSILTQEPYPDADPVALRFLQKEHKEAFTQFWDAALKEAQEMNSSKYVYSEDTIDEARTKADQAWMKINFHYTKALEIAAPDALTPTLYRLDLIPQLLINEAKEYL